LAEALDQIMRRLDEEDMEARVAAQQPVDQELVTPPDLIPRFERADHQAEKRPVRRHATLR
jgi:hypothetical protein